ncbi:YciI family protein [Spirillospora sp. NPDC048911]|uniref:YciI family protein n=1 Tax=Spirillospora sp. NPDC048911 TaxID=3364527 RepID=UPI0037198F32
MIIIYGNQELWASYPADEMQRAIAEQDAFNRKYKDTGELLGAYGNADAVQAKTVRVREGAPVVTDGPYLETKEYLASWYLLDVEDEKRALDVAADMPFASLRAVEVWPVLHEAPGNAL